MIIVIGGIKGGTGKTTLATNLAVLRSKTHKVLLVDADTQGSTTDWINERLNSKIETPWTTIQLVGKSIHEQIAKLKKDYDDIIVDAGGRDSISQRSALLIANLFLIPFKPRSLDVWTIGTLSSLRNEVNLVNKKLKSLAIINQADHQGKDNEDAISLISDSYTSCTKNYLCNRKDFANAATFGMGVCDENYENTKAAQEMRNVYEEIFSLGK